MTATTGTRSAPRRSATRRTGGAPTSRRKGEAAAPNAGFWALAALVATLNVVGLVMVLSASSVQSIDDNGSSWLYFQRQALWVALGTAALVVAARVDYRVWRRFVPHVLIGTAVLLVAVLIPGVGINVNGSSRWLGTGQFRVQPSEFAKLALLLFVAHLLASREKEMHDAARTLRPVLFVTGGFALLLMAQPDMGTTIATGAIVAALLFVGGAPGSWLAGVFGASVLGSVVLAFAEPYRRDRMLAFLHPGSDPMNTGYQINQSLVGLASGGITGLGLGASRAKYGFLPNAHTDFIFAIIGEELGLVGAVIVVALFVAFGFFGVRAALRAPDRFGTLLATGVTVWILVQAVINIGAVIGLLPITGIPLPFVSFGGSSLLVTMAATGLLLNVARQGRT